MDAPLKNGSTLRQQYKQAKEYGVVTPDVKEPEYPRYLQPTLDLFWDIMTYKSRITRCLKLSEVNHYITLFDTPIHPNTLKIILMFDKEYTYELNAIIQERNPT